MPSTPSFSSLPTSVAPARRRMFPKLCGGDLELGNFLTGVNYPGGTAFAASRILLRQFQGVPALAVEKTGAADDRKSGGRERDERSASHRSQDWGRLFLANGGCVYVDLNHIEVCLPEVLHALDHVAYTHALYRLARRALLAANERLLDGIAVHVVANNSDGQNHSYGSHLNVLINRETWEDICCRRLLCQGFLAAYQVSSIIFTGQGKVGVENGAPAMRYPYQLTQRADFMEMLSGSHTTYRRPIVNTRDEALCGGWREALRDRDASMMARMHIIFYDNNLCHVASVLKVGVMQIILAMIEAGAVSLDLLLDDPVRAVVTWSHDPSLKQRARLLSGAETTALELQLRFLEQAQAFVASGACAGIVPQAEEIVQLWGRTLGLLQAGRYAALKLQLDWVLKLSFLLQALREHQVPNWHAPEIKHLDHLYSSLDPADGLYAAYEQRGLTHQLVPNERIVQCLDTPPANTRAWTRAKMLELAAPGEVDEMDWDFMRFVIRDETTARPPHFFTLHLPNPLAGTRAETDQRLPPGIDLRGALAALSAVETTGRSGAFPPISAASPLSDGAGTKLASPPAVPSIATTHKPTNTRGKSNGNQ